MTALPARLRAVMDLDPAAPAVEAGDRWWTWGDLAATADRIEAALRSAGVAPGAPVGILLRNRPAAMGALLGLLRAEACVVTMNPLLGAARVAADAEALHLPMVVGEPADLALLGSAPSSSALVGLGAPGGPLDVVPATDPPPVHVPATPAVAVRMLTSGTTGPPKRIDLTYETLELVMQGAKHYESDAAADVRLRDGVVIVSAPLAHVSGVFRVVQAVLDGRRIALLERFTVAGWADAVVRHRPRTVSLVPTALRMVYDADIDAGVFDSVQSVVSGTMPLDPDLADAFIARYGVPVLGAYGATEFGGGVAGWNLVDHRRYGDEKRGSVGRAHDGCELRIVEPERGAVLEPGEVGVLEVRAAQLAHAGWVRTTDLGRLDADGFLWIVGRADQTIVRGGHKVQPETVRAVLERDPAVREAAVVGQPDERLGAVPVAAVECRPGHRVDGDALLTRARDHLAPYEVPAAVLVVDELPRTASGKADLAAVQALFDDTDPIVSPLRDAATTRSS